MKHFDVLLSFLLVLFNNNREESTWGGSDPEKEFFALTHLVKVPIQAFTMWKESSDSILWNSVGEAEATGEMERFVFQCLSKYP